MELFATVADLWLRIDEPLGTVLGLVVVLLLIRQHVWAWPLGVAYVLVSITVLAEARLYANLALHLVGFLPMNLYGWYYWLFGERRSRSQDAELPVTRASAPVLAVLAAACILVALGLGWYYEAYTDAAFPYWDNAVFAMSLAAMWLTARKKIDNWLVWFVVNVISVAVYYAQGLVGYSILYAVYLPMAVWGYVSWLRSMMASGRSPA